MQNLIKTFEQRYTQHKSDFRNIKAKNKTTLSKYMWDLKENGVNTEIKWMILKNAESINVEVESVMCV